MIQCALGHAEVWWNGICLGRSESIRVPEPQATVGVCGYYSTLGVRFTATWQWDRPKRRTAGQDWRDFYATLARLS